MKHPHEKQLHENFKLIECILQNGKFSKNAKKEIETFLNNPKIHALSIGTLHLFDEKVVISIGYVNKKQRQHSYSVSLKTIGEFTSAESLEKKINALAAKTTNVICHDFFQINNKVHAVLLTSEA